jgi:hypothetical protein
MIRVLHLITSFGLGGAEVNLWRLVCNMDKSRFSNTVVTMVPMRPETGILRPTPEDAEIPFHALEMRRGIANPFSAAHLFRILRQVRPHILQTWMYHADLLGLLVGKFTLLKSGLERIFPGYQVRIAQSGCIVVSPGCRPG